MEFLSFTKENNGRVTKKRDIKKASVDPRTLFDAALDAQILDSSIGADLPQAKFGGPSEPKGDVVSCAVSVSTLFIFISLPRHQRSHSAV